MSMMSTMSATNALKIISPIATSAASTGTAISLRWLRPRMAARSVNTAVRLRTRTSERMNPLSCDLGYLPDPPARPRVHADVYGFGSGRSAKGLMTLLCQSASLPEQWGGTADSKVFKYIGGTEARWFGRGRTDVRARSARICQWTAGGDRREDPRTESFRVHCRTRGGTGGWA